MRATLQRNGETVKSDCPLIGWPVSGKATGIIKGRLTVQCEMLLRVAGFVLKVRESSVHDHHYRIRCAKKAIDILNSFIASEVQSAINAPKGEPGKMSWAEVAKALDISKSAAFARYGKK